MKLTDLTTEQKATYVGLLTEVQKNELVGQWYSPDSYFNPITLDIEIAEHDFSTLAYALYGNQTKSVDDGIYTIYDEDNNIYKQYNLYEIKNQFNELLFEVRENRGTNIDFSKSFTNITS